MLGPLVEWVKVCPEVEVGMGTPREPIHLVDDHGVIRLLTVNTGIDHTASMTAWSARKVAALAGEDLCGFILKAESPSCGPAGVKVHPDAAPATKTGIGLFAQALLARFPDLPIEDEQGLADAQRREQFLERVFAYHRLRSQTR